MTKPLAPLATIRDMDSLQAALRERANSLMLKFDSIDEQSKFPERYTGKLLAPVPLKTVGRQSLGPLLACLGTELLLVERPDALAAYTSRVEKRKRHHTGGRIPANGKRSNPRVGNSFWGKQMRSLQLLKQRPAERKRIARFAIKARWAAVRKAKATSVKTGDGARRERA
jgi:hypothetical protein